MLDFADIPKVKGGDCSCCTDTVKRPPTLRIKAKLRSKPVAKPVTVTSQGKDGTSVISVKIASIRSKYGKSKYQNQFDTGSLGTFNLTL